jgi:hypothetical protein
MTDAERRKLILLAEARGCSAAAVAAVQDLVERLELMKLSPETRVAKDLWSSLIDIRERISQQISEVPS